MFVYIKDAPNSSRNTVEPLWKGQGSLSKVAKFGLFPRTILYKSCLFYPWWQVTSFQRPPSWVAFIEGFHCTCIQNMVIVSCVSAWPLGKIYLDFILLQMENYNLQMISIFSWPHWGYVGSNANFWQYREKSCHHVMHINHCNWILWPYHSKAKGSHFFLGRSLKFSTIRAFHR